MHEQGKRYGLSALIPALAYPAALWALKGLMGLAGLEEPAARALPLYLLAPLCLLWQRRESGGGKEAVPRRLWLAAPALAVCLALAAAGAARRFGAGETAVRDVLTLPALCLTGPLAEECVYRGLVLPRAEKALGSGWALLLSALLFAAAHGRPLQMALALPAGLLFGLLWLRGRSLWPPLLAHCLANALSLPLEGAPLPEALCWAAAAGLCLGLVLLRLRTGEGKKGEGEKHEHRKRAD